MYTINVTRVIDVPIADAWDAIADFGGIYKFHPLVESSPVTNGVHSGNGAERTCHFKGGNAVNERVRDYEEGVGYNVDITDAGSFPLKKASARLEVQPADGDRTEMSFTMHFTPKFGPLGWLMGKTVMKAQFGSILTTVIEGLETHHKTGMVVGPKGQLLAA